MTVFKTIAELKSIGRLSKHDRLVNGLINSIDRGILKKGDMLPSVNSMVKELGYARKTIVKAYAELKERGIVISKNRLGYYIANTDTQQEAKVALILYAFHTFQEEFYNTFIKSLGDNVKLDIFFHHNNIQVFESILESIKSSYAFYVIAPIVKNKPKVRKLLSPIPANKLLLVDRYLKLDSEFSYTVQRFRKPMYQALVSLEDTLKNFNKYILLYKKNADYPKGILNAFEAFFEERNLEILIRPRYEAGSLEKGAVYFTINDTDLWKILKDCKVQNIALGKEVGILSQNENIIKEIISGGITTFSTDFKAMASKASDFVKNKQQMHDIISSKLVRRASL